MGEHRVNGVSSVEFAVRDVGAAAAFYTDVWGLREVEGDAGMRCFRGTGPDHHIVALRQDAAPRLARVNLSAPDEGAVDGLHARLNDAGLAGLTRPAALDRPGGGYGFDFRDREGRSFTVAAGIATHDDTADVADRPRKISHCVLNAADEDGSVAFFLDHLGFKLSDRTKMMSFLRCNSDHHSIAIVGGHKSTLHHVAFEMPDLDSVMRGSARLRDAGYPIEWGIGRHGPGANVFAYFMAPEGFVIEYTAEVEQVDDSYRTGGPDDWGFPDGRTDRWGLTAPPSERMRAAHDDIPFATA